MKIRRVKMPVLSQKQIEYGFDFFHKDESQKKSVTKTSHTNTVC